MEQYIHTLISVGSESRPQSAQIASFLDQLVTQFKFVPISGQRWLPGLYVDRRQWGTSRWTGERISVSESERSILSKFEDIAAAIEGTEHCTVAQSGQWLGEDRPVDLFGTDGVAFVKDYLCTLRCELRPEAVSTSAWDLEAGPNLRDVPIFGSECKNATGHGVFPNPWTGDVIEVAGAGCSRFWIEFEFGKFIYPKVTNNIDVMNPAIVLAAERSFGTKFAQGCRFW